MNCAIRSNPPKHNNMSKNKLAQSRERTEKLRYISLITVDASTLGKEGVLKADSFVFKVQVLQWDVAGVLPL
jgi:hypothetical protein